MAKFYKMNDEFYYEYDGVYGFILSEYATPERIEAYLDDEEFEEAMAWKYATQVLWDEYGCCYYKCKNFLFTAFAEENNESLLEMYELAREIKDEIPKRFS